MKGKILNMDGKSIGEIDLPKIFSSNVREDICQKYFEISKKMQPYAPFVFAGMLYSASGKIRHQRHKWKTAYGRGISRVPRKIFWRRGTQFYWEAATVSGTRGGRKAHHPKVEKFLVKKKVNKKEKKLAFNSAIASTASIEWIKNRYKTLENKEIKLNLPLIVESKIINLKTKEFLFALQKILDDLYEIAIKKKNIRAGKGKGRGRKYKLTRGLLFIIGKDEKKTIKGIDIVKVNQLAISDLYPLGRLTIYTEQAIKDLEEKK